MDVVFFCISFTVRAAEEGETQRPKPWKPYVNEISYSLSFSLVFLHNEVEFDSSAHAFAQFLFSSPQLRYSDQDFPLFVEVLVVVVVVFVVNLLHCYLFCADFNQTLHKASLGEGS